VKTEERMREASAPAAKKNIVVQKFEVESCVHAVDLERYETRPEFPFGRQAQNTVLILSPRGCRSSFEKNLRILV
jgi:hypothetical protein